MSYSSYWNNRTDFDFNKLVDIKKAVANYATIITGRDIPVMYADSGDSYTDGNKIVIGCSIKTQEDIDVIVGLALHESAHIRYTDFDFLSKYNILNIVESALPNVKGHVVEKFYRFTRLLLNLVEDFRIDDLIYQTAPGYQEYYSALYKKYFYNETVDVGLKSTSFCDETFDSYEFRLINIRNSNSDLTKLKGLSDAWKILDLANISRLRSVEDSFGVAIGIMKAVAPHIIEKMMADEQNSNNSHTSDGSSENDNNGELNAKPAKRKPKTDLNRKQVKEAKQFVEDQKDFIEGVPTRELIDGDINRIIDNVIEHNITVESNIFDSDYGKVKYNSVFFEDPQKAILDGKIVAVSHNSAVYFKIDSDEIYAQGVSLGKALSNKVEVRNASKLVNRTRLKVGKIDNRMLAHAGAGVDSIFKHSFIDAYKPANIHVSLDTSSSMLTNNAWENSITLCIALMYLSTTVKNINVSISARTLSTILAKERSNLYDIPANVMLFDSKKDNFVKCAKFISNLVPVSGTPEGLCYPKLAERVFKNRTDDNYFITITDGAPSTRFRSVDGGLIEYKGNGAYRHIKEQIKALTDSGIKCMAYFVSNDLMSNAEQGFNKAYGVHGTILSVDNIPEIAKTLNKFLINKI